MVTEGNVGLGSSEKEREGQQMDESFAAFFNEVVDIMQESYAPRLGFEDHELFAEPSPTMVGGRMATERNGGLGLSEEVREGQLMGPTLRSVAAFPMEDSTQNTFPWLDSYVRKRVSEAFEHFVKSGPAMVGGSVAAFPMEASTQNTSPWLDSYVRKLVSEALELFVKLGPASVAAFPMEDSTQNTSPWLDSYIRKLVSEAFEHFVKSGPAMVGGREQIQEPDRRILQLRFETSMPAHFSVGKKVEGQAGAICVKLIDATTDHVVASGPLSEMNLDVVVLAGDFNNKDDDGWTWEHFISNVETEREGKVSLLEGDLQVPLKGGVGSLAEFKFTDISTCTRSGKFRLGVKVEQGFFKGIRVREAKTAAFKVKHYKKESEEKHVTRALDDDVHTLRTIGKKGTFRKNLNNARIFKVKDFLWKLGLDPEGLRTILGRTLSEKNWKTLGDHARESVQSWKYHVYYADNTKNSGVVFKDMSELCGLIEDGKYHLAETLSDSQKESADTLKKVAGDNWKDIAEYDDPLLLEMNRSKRARSSQTEVVTAASESCPSGIDQPTPASPTVPSGEASENSVPDSEDLTFDYIPDDVLIELQSPSPNPSEKADGNTELSVGTHGGSFEQGKQLGGSNSPRIVKEICCQGSSIYPHSRGSHPMNSRPTWSGGNDNMGVGNTSSLEGNYNMGFSNTSSLEGNYNMGFSNTSSLGGNVNIPSPFQGNINMGNINLGFAIVRESGSIRLRGNVKCEGGGARNTSWLPGNVKCEGGGARNTSSHPGNVRCEGGGDGRREMASLDYKFEKLSVNGD